MRRVLVIDDHEPSRKNLFRVLAESGFEVAGEGASGAGALELSLATNPDGILMANQGLSEADAFALIKRKRKSMDMRKPMAEIAQALVLSGELANGIKRRRRL